jgi:hypothetical protein
MLSAQEKRPMHQLSMDEMRQVFARVYGFMPDLDRCKYFVEESTSLFQADQSIVVLDWREGLDVIAGEQPGNPLEAKRVPVTADQQCEVINYLLHECDMSFTSNVPEPWLKKALRLA